MTQNPDVYFANLSRALNDAGVAEPALVIDTNRLAENCAAVATIIADRKHVRVVAKSLPCAKLLDTITANLKTHRYMVFNRAMLSDVIALDPAADILLGKPLPVAAAAAYYAIADSNAASPQWLIDTADRMAQYSALAQERGLRLRVNFEIDVGLHRGGFTNPDDLASVLHNLPGYIQPCGLMGYDPHIAKFPAALRGTLMATATNIYAAMKQVLDRAVANRVATEPLTYNAAGSPTFAMHTGNALITEVAIGSAFVKPTDFDLDSLTTLVPASFIATPVLKVRHNPPMLAADLMPAALGRMMHSGGTALFCHGGHWLADAVHPPGLGLSKIYGQSSNQERWSSKATLNLRPDDWFFLRPRQSEAVFLQFGPLLAFDGERITNSWPSFAVSA